MNAGAVMIILAIMLLLLYDRHRTAMKYHRELREGRASLSLLLKEREEFLKGRIMTRKQREAYKRRAVPDAILEGLERAWETGRLTRTEVNEAYRIVSSHYRYGDLKVQKLLGNEEVVRPTTDKKPPQSHFERVKSSIRKHMYNRPVYERLFSKPNIPGDQPVQDVGPKKEKGTLFGRRSSPTTPGAQS